MYRLGRVRVCSECEPKSSTVRRPPPRPTRLFRNEKNRKGGSDRGEALAAAMGERRAKTLVSLLKTEGEGKGEGGEVIKFPSDSLIHFAESQGRLSAQEELGNG